MNEHQALVFARCIAFIFRAPGFSHPSVPPQVRAGLAGVLALGFDHLTDARPPAVFALAFIEELAFGFALGAAASAIYDAAYSGGRAVDDYVGIRSAVPSVGNAAGAGFGRLWSLLFTAGFFVLGGYRLAISAFAETFSSVPVGTFAGTSELVNVTVTTLATVARTAVMVAAPAIAAAFVAQVALGFAARVVPKLASFSLSFPIIFACALIATLVALPVLVMRSTFPWLAFFRLGRS
ncbi:MAG TPA: flagellar biosynthetic protein FliR [Candidatus Baltobacteraceae bacterium]|nr:flagellar biosynthetic protein FliR [Candidatus Baltobacteraceae bacterium]